jgi:hypothetical protein
MHIYRVHSHSEPVDTLYFTCISLSVLSQTTAHGWRWKCEYRRCLRVKHTYCRKRYTMDAWKADFLGRTLERHNLEDWQDQS